MTNRLKKLVLREVSLVDRGANPHAHIMLMKRADDQLPNDTKPIYRVGHEPAHKRLSGEVMEMTAEEIAKLKADLKAAEDKATRADAISKLAGEERAFFDRLATDKQDEFLKQDMGKRLDVIEAAKRGKEVVYTSASGETFTKADDPRLVALAKQLDAERVETRKARDLAEHERLKKRAEDEFGMLPGTADEKAKVLKAIEAIPDKDEREAALKMLRAGQASAQNDGYFRKHTGRGGDASSPDAQLDTLAKAYQKDHKDLTYEQAFTHVVSETPEGKELYQRSVN